MYDLPSMQGVKKCVHQQRGRRQKGTADPDLMRTGLRIRLPKSRSVRAVPDHERPQDARRCAPIVHLAIIEQPRADAQSRNGSVPSWTAPGARLPRAEDSVDSLDLAVRTQVRRRLVKSTNGTMLTPRSTVVCAEASKDGRAGRRPGRSPRGIRAGPRRAPIPPFDHPAGEGDLSGIAPQVRCAPNKNHIWRLIQNHRHRRPKPRARGSVQKAFSGFPTFEFALLVLAAVDGGRDPIPRRRSSASTASLFTRQSTGVRSVTRRSALLFRRHSVPAGFGHAWSERSSGLSASPRACRSPCCASPPPPRRLRLVHGFLGLQLPPRALGVTAGRPHRAQ